MDYHEGGVTLAFQGFMGHGGWLIGDRRGASVVLSTTGSYKECVYMAREGDRTTAGKRRRSFFLAFRGMQDLAFLSDDLRRAKMGRRLFEIWDQVLSFCNCICLSDLHRRGFNLDVILMVLINQPARPPCVVVEDTCAMRRRTGCATKI